MKIYAFHLLNDYSGSPKVLMQLLKGWNKNGIEVHLSTCSGRKGFLSDLEGVQYHFFKYTWAENRILRLFNLLISQVRLCFNLYFKVNKEDIIYINTVLPFGAAFLGKLLGCRIIYHVHETTMKPPILKKALFGIARWAASDVVYVSDFLSKQEPFENSTHILYNAIEKSFLNEALINRQQKVRPYKVLMVCSLKPYKGVNEFVLLAKQNPHYQFNLVLNASMSEIDNYFEGSSLPSNLDIFDTKTDLHPFYRWADIILNLSRPDGWVETFGLTIIEGMAYGLPAIVPPVGGITELVEENKNGFLVDSRNVVLLSKKLNDLFRNHELYCKMANHSKVKIEGFSEEQFIQRSLSILQNKRLLKKLEEASSFWKAAKF
jgi:glycosyltransferase involved in cell wall biosynthesis